jgi:predicted membrane protein
MERRKMAALALFVALALATNFLLYPLWNIKLMDFLVFTTGLFLGPVYGIASGVLVWLVYGTLNPLGFNLLVLAMVIPLEALYGLAGGLIRKWGFSAWKAGLAGLIVTFIYDFFTNGFTGLLFYGGDFMLGLKVGAPFAIVHETSNLLIFSFLSMMVYPRINRLIGLRGVKGL